MKTIRFVIEILLITAAVLVMLYNFSIGNRIAYSASIVAVCGTVAILVRDIYKTKKEK